MPPYDSKPAHTSIGILLLTVGIITLMCAGVMNFGDRMPNPSPDIKLQFEERDRTTGYVLVGAGVTVFVGVCFLSASSGNSTRWRNQKQD